MKIRAQITEAIATAGYVGYIPFAPGTFGAAIGCLIYLAVPYIPVAMIFIGLAGFIAFSVWIAGEAEKILNSKDPGCVIIDEIAGMMVTFFALPRSVYIGIAGFVIFRFFDILKPFPIKWMEKKFSGGFGVVIDDVAAGVISNIVLRLLLMIKHS